MALKPTPSRMCHCTHSALVHEPVMAVPKMPCLRCGCVEFRPTDNLRGQVVKGERR